MTDPELYMLMEGDTVYAVVLTKHNLEDPVGAIQMMYDKMLVGAFVAFTALEYATKSMKIALSLPYTPKGFYAYIVKVRIKDFLELFYNYRNREIQVFKEISEVKDKVSVEELCLKKRK